MAFADEIETHDHHADPASGPRGFLAVLWQRKALVVLGTLLGLMGGAILFWQRPAVYQATFEVLVIKRMPNLPFAFNNNMPNVPVIEDFISTHISLLRSPYIIGKALQKNGVAALKTFENSGDPAGQMGGGLLVSRDSKENNIILLSYRGPIAEDCSKILAAVVESYQEFLDQNYRNVKVEAVGLITKARDEVKLSVEKSEAEYRKFREQMSPFWTNEKGVPLKKEQADGLEAKRSAVLNNQTELRVHVQMIEKALKEGRDISPTLLRTLESKNTKADANEKVMQENLLALLLQENQLLEIYGDDHPQVASARKKAQVIRDHFTKLAKAEGQEKTNDPVQIHLTALREKILENDLIYQAYSKQLADLTEEARKISSLVFTEDNLREEVARSRELWKAIIKNLEEQSLVRDSGGFNVKTMSQPPTGSKIAPSAFQMIAGGLMLGLLLGVGLAYLADISDKSFRNPDEVRRRLGLPVLGHIPFLKPDPEMTRRVLTGEVTVDPLLYALFQPKSLESEAYRAVRTSLFFATQDEGHKVLQVTSPTKGDGKSLMVGNLAISMAQSGKKVLVIDADCRRPRQHKVFGLPNTKGLATVISEGVEWKEAIHATPVDGLWIMPSGPIPPNPSELLSNPRFKELLETARIDFDFVMVDTPPLLAVTDPCVVAGKVDGVLLILRLTRHGRYHAGRAREILMSLGVKILGVVVNGVARQGGAGIYSFEQYDYTESYTQSESTDDDDGYYYEDEPVTDEPVAAETKR